MSTASICLNVLIEQMILRLVSVVSLAVQGRYLLPKFMYEASVYKTALSVIMRSYSVGPLV